MSQNKIEYFTDMILKKSEYSDVFGIFKKEHIFGRDMISCMPIETAKTIEEARTKLRAMIDHNNSEKFVIAKILETGCGEKKIKDEYKLKPKQFAVFTFPEHGPKDKIYFWGIVEGFNRSIAYGKIEKHGFWYARVSKEIFLYELKNRRLLRNYFHGIPILNPYEPNYSGGTIKGAKSVPIKEILPK